MFRSVFASLVIVVLLAACGVSSGATPASGPDLAHDRSSNQTPDLTSEQQRDPDSAPHSDPGGSSGTEGLIAPCVETPRVLATRDTVSERVGMSTADLLELANRQHEVSLRWPALDSGPKLEHSATTMTVEVTAGDANATEFICNDPAFPKRYLPEPRIELPVVVTLRTADGAIDEHLSAVLSSTERDRAEIAQLTLQPEAVGGRLGAAVGAYYTGGTRTLTFQLSFRSDGVFGSVMGPFSPHKADPCAYTEYAYWPAEALCWPFRSGEPIDDSDAMRPHLARINRSFELVWSDADNQRTTATFHAELADGETCDFNRSVSHPVKLQITTADGRVDLTLPAMLSGGPSTIDPWPAKLKNVEPFALDLYATVALDASALAAQLSITDPNVSAAIVSLYLSSPVAIDSPVLEGRLRVVPIDRTGFDTLLPTVLLPGGDSEQCFSSSGRSQILVGNLAQR